MNYAHLHLVDSFYAAPDGRGEKVRVTRDEKSGVVQACVQKVRLGSLDIYSPKRAADWRISVNVEIPGQYARTLGSPIYTESAAVPQPIGTATHTRRKDRMSYTHEEFIVDLTQVTSTFGASSKVPVYFWIVN